MPTLSEVDLLLTNKCDRLRAAESAAEWRFFQGDALGAHLPAYDDSSWPTVRLSYTWAGANGDAWFRRTFTFPEEIEGIATAGSRIEMPALVAIHSALYVDGVERVAEPSWLDTRAVPLVLCEHYQPGVPVHVALRAYGGDGFGIFIVTQAEVSAIEDALLRLGTVRAQLRFAHHLAYEAPSANPAWQSAWQDAAARLDAAALAANQWDAWWRSVARALDVLAPLAQEAKGYTTHLVAHSHIDMNWLWTWGETKDVIRRDFATMDGLMERYPDFRFSHSQASTYKAMQEEHPALLERVRRRITQGAWEVTASTWVEGDMNLASGESLVRQLLLTRPYIEHTLGVRPRICWEPDTFGHCATLPQLLQQAGIDSYYFCRAGQGQPLFWWEGIDGSRVLAFNDPLGYNGVITPDAVEVPAEDLSRRYGLRRGLYLYGVGDHGGGATARDIERGRALDGTPLLPRAQMSSLAAFYDAVRAPGAKVPIIRGELNTTFEGCYTTHGDIKMLNRRNENALLSTEAIAALAKTLAGAPYPIKALTDNWRTVLFHQFHDIICGCAIGATYRESAGRLVPALESTNQLCREAIARLTDRVDTRGGPGPCVVVWNPLAWARSDVVRVDASTFGTHDSPGGVPASLVDDAGNVLPTQRVGSEVLFVARDVPALGCRVYRPTTHAASSDLVAEEGTLTNAMLRFHVHPSSGAIDSLVDLQSGRTVDTMSTWRGVERKQNAGLLNRLQICWEQPHPMSAWNIGDITRVDNLLSGAAVQLAESGPVRGSITVSHKVLHSTITQRYLLYAGLRRVDVETELDWHERGGKDVDAPMLRATFKPMLGPSVSTFEVPFAGLERPATGDEVPAQRWADVSDGAYGVSLLNNGKYGHQAHGSTLSLTLVRAAYEPDNQPDKGTQSFAYALYPHPGNWRQAGTDRRAAEFNQPLLACATGAHGGPIKPGCSTLTCEPANVMVTALKRSETEDHALIVRLVEMHGMYSQARLQWAWDVERVQEVNILEEPQRDVPASAHGCEVTLHKHKIVTLKLTLPE